MTKPNAKKHLNTTKNHMPLYVADSYHYWGDDNTVFLQSMKGCEITDVDNQTFVDFRLAYGPVILGYRDERIDNAVIDAIQNIGVISGFSVPIDSEVIELVKKLCPQIEKMRFANSGTKAVFGAVRTARGYTGKNKVVAVEFRFHGIYDEMMWKSDVDNWNGDRTNDPEIMPRAPRSI